MDLEQDLAQARKVERHCWEDLGVFLGAFLALLLACLLVAPVLPVLLVLGLPLLVLLALAAKGCLQDLRAARTTIGEIASPPD
jgi:NhaP-type Na+/H+ or K+/H+ antiporter